MIPKGLKDQKSWLRHSMERIIKRQKWRRFMQYQRQAGQEGHGSHFRLGPLLPPPHLSFTNKPKCRLRKGN